MSSVPHMTDDEIRALKARMEYASKRIEAEQADTPVDPIRNRMIADALAVSAWERGWRPQHDAERVAEKISILRRLHGSTVQSTA